MSKELGVSTRTIQRLCNDQGRVMTKTISKALSFVLVEQALGIAEVAPELPKPWNRIGKAELEFERSLRSDKDSLEVPEYSLEQAEES